MAALTNNQSTEARRRAVVVAFPNGATVTVTKAQMDTATAAVSAWLDANAASFLSAISGTVLAGASTNVQAAVLGIVADVKYSGTVV